MSRVDAGGMLSKSEMETMCSRSRECLPEQTPQLVARRGACVSKSGLGKGARPSQRPRRGQSGVNKSVKRRKIVLEGVLKGYRRNWEGKVVKRGLEEQRVEGADDIKGFREYCIDEKKESE